MRINNEEAYNKFRQTTKGSLNSSGKTKHISLDEMPKGTLVKGKVNDIVSHQIKISLEDGQTIDARISKDVTLSIGEEILFEVQSNTDGKLILKPLPDQMDETMSKQLLQILSSTGLEESQENESLVKALLRQQLPVNRDAVLNLRMYTKRFPKSSPDKMAFLIKNNYPVTKETLDFADQLFDQTESTNTSLQSLAGNLIENSFNPAGNQSLLALVGAEDSKAYTWLNQLQDILQEQNPEKASTSWVNYASKGLDLLDHESKINLGNHLLNIYKESEETLESLDSVKSLDFFERFVVSIVDQFDTNAINQTSSLDKELYLGQEGFTRESVEQMKVLLHETPSLHANEEKTLQLWQDFFDGLGEDEKTLFLKTFLKTFSDIGLGDEAKTMSQEVYKSIGRHLISENLFMRPEDLLNKKTPVKHMLNLEEKMQRIQETLGGDSSSVARQIAEDTQGIRNDLQLTRQLQVNYTFIPIPIHLNGKDTLSQLYIMKKRQNSKDQHTDSVSALLRLDLVNLGHLDIYIAKRDKNLEMTFYVDKAETKQSIQAEEKVLVDRLVQKTYNVLGLSIKTNESASPILDQLFIADQTNVERRLTFDVRT